jgi:hypothetical protein
MFFDEPAHQKTKLAESKTVKKKKTVTVTVRPIC